MFDHYIALDWAQNNMAIARMTKDSSQIKVLNLPANLQELKLYLSRLRGKKIFTFEETTSSQWLYVELRDYADEILICDPFRNHLLSDGPKTDRHDAIKLAQLLKANLLKPVFHTADQFINFRKLVSGYEDVVKAGVRLKNQRAALFRAQGKDQRTEDKLTDEMDRFVLEGMDRGIEAYESEKKRYELQIQKLRRKHLMIRNIDQIFGIGPIGAVKIVARVVDPKRFSNKGQWLSYCGLIRQEKLSGGRSYGWKKSRYCRTLKSVFKIAALTAIQTKESNPFREHYEFLLREKGYAEYHARHAVARRIAILTWGVLKSGKAFDVTRILKTAKE